MSSLGIAEKKSKLVKVVFNTVYSWGYLGHFEHVYITQLVRTSLFVCQRSSAKTLEVQPMMGEKVACVTVSPH